MGSARGIAIIGDIMDFFADGIETGCETRNTIMPIIKRYAVTLPMVRVKIVKSCI